MAEIIEAEPFPPDAEKLLQEVLALCDGKDVQTIVNVLANAMLRVTKGNSERLRKFITDMIDAHLAQSSQRTGTVPQS